MSNKIGRFEILSELSKSGIGCVYKATETESGQTVALKTLRLEALGDDAAEFAHRLLEEAKASKVLSSHNIAQLHAADEIEGQFCAAMEYVQGNSIGTMLARDEAFSIWDIQDVARQACQALDHASAHKVAHYSLEPGKIMSGWDGTVKVLGFGVSAMSVPSAQLHGQIPDVTYYMSPEQLRGEPIDLRSNLFSLGAILYEMLTQQKPFNGGTEEEIWKQIQEGTPPAPHEINHKINPDVSVAILKVLSKSPDDRQQNGKQLVADLEGRKEETTVASAAAAKQKPAAKSAAAPQKAAPSGPVAPQPEPPAPEAAKPASAAAKTAAPAAVSTKKAAAAAAGWGPSNDSSTPRTPKLDPSEQFITSCVKASLEVASKPATMSAAPVKEPDVDQGFAVDPAVDGSKKNRGPASVSFSELSELPPLKEIYVPPPPPPPVDVPQAVAEPASPRLRPRAPERPKIQPKEVAKKAVEEIQKTPPQLFLYSMSAAVVVIVLIVGFIAYRVHSESSQDDGTPRPVVSQQTSEEQSQEASAAQTAAPQAIDAPESQDDTAVITVKAKPAPRKSKTPAPTVVIPGQLTVNSIPAGAQISIDGQSESGWLTPYDLTGVAPGQHTVTISKPGYASETRTIEVVSRSKSVMTLQLATLSATLTVTSDPAGAKVFLDGKDLGHVTPFQVPVDKPGNHTVLVRKDGYLDETSTLNLQAGVASHFTPTLRKLGATDEIKIKKFLGGGQPDGTGSVSIKTDPKGAQIAVNRRVLDKPSPVNFFLNPGTYVVDITASGYKPFHRVINVEKGGKLNIEETLEHE